MPVIKIIRFGLTLSGFETGVGVDVPAEFESWYRPRVDAALLDSNRD